MWRRYVRLLFRFAVVSFRDMSEFRIDFFTSILHNLIYQAIFIIFWKSIVDFTAGSLGDWTFPELAILSAFTLVATAIMQWFIGLLQLSPKVLEGEVDKYLCRPISPLFALIAEEIDGLASLQQLVSAGLILAGVCIYYEVPVAAADVLTSFALLGVGCAVVVLIQGCIGLLSFWFGDVGRVQSLFMISGEFERYPINLFPGWLRVFLVWVIPIGLISTYPVLVFLGRAGIAVRFLLIAVLLAGVWVAIFSRMWTRALARYESFGG